MSTNTYSAYQKWTGPNVVNDSRKHDNTFNERTATALKVFSGEVFSAFNSATIFKGLVRSYDLRGAKEKQFLLTGTLTAKYHEAGKPILPMDGLKTNERVIRLDDLLVSSQFVYSLDEIISQHFLFIKTCTAHLQK